MAADDRYRLTPVRDARARDAKQREGDLAVAAAGARSSEAVLATARARVVRARDVLARATAARDRAASVIERVRAEQYVARCRHLLDAAVGEELRAEAAHDASLGQIDLARRRLARARADREVIERHFERWRDEQKKLAERRED